MATFSLAFKAGIELSKNAANKLKNIILPAGAINEKNILNKCLNCNLCISVCPNNVIKKANENFSTIHIEYDGKNYCKYDCNECSKACPSGALKNISLEEKQKTQIAVAKVNPDKCIKCGNCIFECPTKAISRTSYKVPSVVDESKCIGCGLCKKVCNSYAINIFAVNEQKII